MNILIKIQHLTSVTEVEVCALETLQDLKKRIETIYAIPAAQQALMLDDRNISTSMKALNELGLRPGSIVVVKKIHKFRGQDAGMDMASIAQNPMVKSMMKNPDFIKSIKTMFPDLQEESAKNKTLNMLLNSGGLEEELERMSMDGNYLNEQMRNADLAMAKLENIPGGINMMSGMYKELEDPFKMVLGEQKLNEGSAITSKMTTSLPGSSKRNLLVEYRKQLSELKEIGFTDTRENLRVLSSVDGDLAAALLILAEKDYR
ncbi:hypothetical protein PAPHI01_1645 [Pancytospora philotis]|nr:hypothetical protein PAPHI01_1645 [Pancytospora philotis]